MKSLQYRLSFTFITFILVRTLSFAQPEVPQQVVIISEILDEFRKNGDSIWPGFDFSSQTVLVYEPNNWVLLLNAESRPKGFENIPGEWPDLGATSYVYFGKYKDLSGQLTFNYDIDGHTTVAIGLISSNFSIDYQLAEYIVHESFHQFQASEFNSFPYYREEYYPILNPENAAMAFLEMSFGRKAILSMIQNNTNETKEMIARFCAIRKDRWSQMDPFIQNFEIGLENKEATAEYVGKSIAKVFFPNEQEYWDWILEGFNRRIANHTIAPTDVARNKVYPIGLTQALILDFFQVDWKSATSKAAETDALFQMLIDSLDFDQKYLDATALELLEGKEYSQALEGSNQLTEEYKFEFNSQFEEFKHQEGIQFEFVVPSNGLSRSRSSSSSRYYLRSGKDIFCKDYKIYSLKGADFIIQVFKNGVFETNDYKGKQKVVYSFHRNIGKVILNNREVTLSENGVHGFMTLEIIDQGLSCKIDRKGVMLIQEGKVQVVIYP